jgi:hypothetical protein
MGCTSGVLGVCVGCSWGVLGVYLGCTWGVLGVCLGWTWGVLGVYLGCTWGVLGVYLGCTWGVLGVYLGCTCLASCLLLGELSSGHIRSDSNAKVLVPGCAGRVCWPFVSGRWGLPGGLEYDKGYTRGFGSDCQSGFVSLALCWSSLLR